MLYPLVSFLITYQRRSILSKKTNKKTGLHEGSLGLQMYDKSAKNNLNKFLVSLLILTNPQKVQLPFDRLTALSNAEWLSYAATFVTAAYT